jgi:putative membrane protein
MKNKKLPISIIGSFFIAGAAIFGSIETYAARVPESEKAGTSEVESKETESSESGISKVKSKETESSESGTDKSEYGMVYLQADAQGNLKTENADTDLPVSVKVSYYLNGQQMSPEEIAGKSGKVKMRFDYTNHTAETVEVDGKKLTVNVPYMMISAVMMPGDTFSNVEVSNGKVMEDDDRSIVVGVAYPSLSDNLQLGKSDITKDIDLPDYVEITADAAEFELEFTANAIAPLGFDEIEEADFNDIDDMIASMDELGEASEALVDGTGALLDGLKTFQTAMEVYTGGVSQLNDGIKTINAALAKTSLPGDDSMESVTAAASALAADAAALGQEMQLLQSSASGLQTFVQNVATYKTTVEAAVSDSRTALGNAKTDVENADTSATQQAKVQAQAVLEAALNNSGLSEAEKQTVLGAADYGTINITGTTGQANENIADAEKKLSGIPQFAMPDMTMDVSGILAALTDMQTQIKVLSSFSSGLSGLTEGMNTLTGALKQLESGAQQLTENNSKVLDGIQTIVEGAQELDKGMQTFDKEGIQELQDLAGEDLQNLVRRFKAVRKAEMVYKRSSSGSEGANYVIETDSINVKSK